MVAGSGVGQLAAEAGDDGLLGQVGEGGPMRWPRKPQPTCATVYFAMASSCSRATDTSVRVMSRTPRSVKVPVAYLTT